MDAPGRTGDWLEWGALSLSVALAGIHLYLGLFDPAAVPGRSTQFLLIGVVLLAGPAIYVTPFWRPVCYLLGAVFAVVLGVLWVLGGMQPLFLGLVTGVLATAFVGLTIWLFVRESRPTRE